MENYKKYLNNFKCFVVDLTKTQSGNFIQSLDEQIQQPTEVFFHSLCRKIDIKKRLFVDYDSIKDLKQTDETLLDDNGHLKVIYILVYLLIITNIIALKYKALNTLLKIIDLLSDECKKNNFIKETNSIIIEIL